MWKNIMTSGAAASLETKALKTGGVVSPALSKKIPRPLMFERTVPP